MSISKIGQFSLILVLFVGPLDATPTARADGVQEWLCRLVRYPNCAHVSKLAYVRTLGSEYATTIVIYDPATNSRKLVACEKCRDPLPISATQIAVRTNSGLAVVEIDNPGESRTYPLPGVRHLLARDPSNSTWVVAVGDGSCPQLAMFDPRTGQLSRAGVPDHDENSCPLPRPGRIKNDEQIVLSGDHTRSAIYSRSIDRPADDSKLVVPRAPDDSSIWFDPQWFGDKVIYAIH